MAAQIVLDIVEGASSSHDLMQGWTITRVCIVTGVNPIGALSDPQLKAAAESVVISVIGDRGSACTTITAPTFLQRFDEEIIGSDCVKVRVTYKGYPIPVYEFDSSLNMVESNLDASGNPVTVQYTYPTKYPLDKKLQGITVTQGGVFRRPTAEALFIVRFIIAPGIQIPASPSGTLAMQQMTWLKLTYEGRVNNATYTVGLLSGAPRCWLIEKVSGVSRDGMLTYEASMTLHYKPVPPTPSATPAMDPLPDDGSGGALPGGWGGQTPGGWDSPTTFIDPNTGMPPRDVLVGIGSKLVRSYPSGDFPQLPGTTGGAAVPNSPLNFWGN
jgi:hypothetical protein